MNFAYLILAHDAFDQLERLAARLLEGGEDDRVYIHVDRKARLPKSFLARVPAELRNRVHLLPDRTRVYWAHHSQCAAMLKLLEAALTRPFDHCHLLSGRDWPLVPRAAMVRDFEAARNRDCFIDIEGERFGWRMDDYTLEDRKLSPHRKPLPLLWRWDALLRRIQERLNRELAVRDRRRSHPLGPWVKGSQWWSLPRDAAEHARDALAGLSASGRLRYTQCSDEHVVPTALFNSAFRERLAPNRRFTRWPEGSWSPAILTRADLGEADGCWFARKFDAAADDFFYRL